MTVLERVRARVGWRDTPREHVIDADDVARFCAAIGDPSPQWRCEVPPTYLLAVGWCGAFERVEEASGHGTRWLNGGDVFEFDEPIAIGARVHSQTELVDAYGKDGRSGELLFLVFETRYADLDGRVLARHRATRIRR